MKTYTILLILVVLLFGGCAGRLKVIPEITGALKEDVLYQFKKGEDIAEKMIVHDGQLIFLTLQGDIRRLDPKAKMVNFLYNLDAQIEPEIAHYGRVIALKEKNADRVIVFDIGEMKIVNILEKLDVRRVTGIGNGVVSLLTKNALLFYDYINMKPLQTVPRWKDRRFRNFVAADDGNRLYVCFSVAVCEYVRNGGAPRIISLQYPAASGLMVEGDAAYYGSADRHLVRLNLRSNRVKWRFLLADHLRTPPLNAHSENLIAVTPQDNNIYFFNKNGTLKWWEKLQSTRTLPPMVMEKNVAVTLWSHSIRFYDFEKKRNVLYPIGTPLFTPPVEIDGDVYIVSALPDYTATSAKMPRTILKIGNNYGIALTTDPEYIVPKGKSIRFDLAKFNLIEPELNIKVLDPNGTMVFNTVIPHKKDASFVWIPDHAWEYKLVVEINALNKKGLIVEETFQVEDVEAMLNEYYYHVQADSRENDTGKVVDDPPAARNVPKANTPAAANTTKAAAPTDGSKTDAGTGKGRKRSNRRSQKAAQTGDKTGTEQGEE